MNTREILTFLAAVISYFALNVAFSTEVTVGERVKLNARDLFINGPVGDKDYNAADKKAMFHEAENPLGDIKDRVPTAEQKHKNINVQDVEQRSGSAKQFKDAKGFEPVKYDFEEDTDPLI